MPDLYQNTDYLIAFLKGELPPAEQVMVEFAINKDPVLKDIVDALAAGLEEEHAFYDYLNQSEKIFESTYIAPLSASIGGTHNGFFFSSRNMGLFLFILIVLSAGVILYTWNDYQKYIYIKEHKKSIANILQEEIREVSPILNKPMAAANDPIQNDSFHAATISLSVDKKHQPLGGGLQTHRIKHDLTATTRPQEKIDVFSGLPLPITTIVSINGKENVQVLRIKLSEKFNSNFQRQAKDLETVMVSGSRVFEKRGLPPLSTVNFDHTSFKEAPAPNFYAGLGAMREVNQLAINLAVQTVNTRGFNSTNSVRSLQLIDGIDNQSPGLNFSLGNFWGISELDVNRVDLIFGPSSAFYGPNAFNGVINIESKDPFMYPGLNVMIKGGGRSYFEGGIRWAESIKNRKGQGIFAYKFNIAGFSVDDWTADNYNPVYRSPSGITNPGGFDQVNSYGDEYSAQNDFSNSLFFPGLGVIHRTGYKEKELVDQNSWNIKTNAAFYLRLQPEKGSFSPELIASSSFNTGSTVYQGNNRYQLKNAKFFQHRLELKKRDQYFLRLYATHEDAGNSYDPYFTALLLQEKAKPHDQWRADYLNFWASKISPRLKSLRNYPNLLDFLGKPTQFNNDLQEFLGTPALVDSLNRWHTMAGDFANRPNPLNDYSGFFEPGSLEFAEEFKKTTTDISFAEGGAGIYNKSGLINGQGEYQFTDLIKSNHFTDLDIVIGANARQYMPDTKGSILLDTVGRNIHIFEYGFYGGGSLEINNRFRVNATTRLDKHQNFNFQLSPSLSLVYNPNPKQALRLSFSSAVRNPTLSDQYLHYNAGRVKFIGNTDGIEDLITAKSLGGFLLSRNESQLVEFDVEPLRPEKVQTFELAYHNTFLECLQFDANYYYSFYQDFLGFNSGVKASFDPISNLPIDLQVFQIAANATEQVTTQGVSTGFNYQLGKNYTLYGNYSWNQLNTQVSDPIIPAYNTPEHKFNIGFSGRNLSLNMGNFQIRNLGFNLQYKWIDGYLFEGSPQFTGLIPAQGLLDFQVNIHKASWHTTFKLGGTNLLDQANFQVYGAPQIGRFVYISVSYNWIKT